MSETNEMLLSGMLRSLRSTLYSCAEPAGKEAVTAGVIASFLRPYRPDELVTGIAGHGVAAVYEGRQPGPTLLVRCELDALPTEVSRAATSTRFEDSAHLCGHDGHMAIVAGLAPLLHVERPERGRVVLLFQPAEETGAGALQVIESREFAALRPDQALALHNLPGFPRNTIVYRPGNFASASVGMNAYLRGTSSHAAEPEKACTPTAALCELLSSLPELNDVGARPYRLLTVTHTRLGRPSYGTTPGHARLLATLRAATSAALDELCEAAAERIREVAGRGGFELELSWHERFPGTTNDEGLVRTLVDECAAAGIATLRADKPFRWSEDFGHFAQVCPITLFGLGIGEDATRLHQPDYAFPDEVVETGRNAFMAMIRHLTSSANPA